MKIRKRYLISLLCIFGLALFIPAFNNDEESSLSTANHPIINQPIKSAADDHFINSLLDRAILDYNSNGYFSSYYQPTLQATYQAISILNAIGSLSQVDENEILRYIMGHYSTDNRSFIDAVALRYLDADFSQQYYPLQTHMEITCYAVLTLAILNQLEHIETQEVVSFIWSCYQPVTSGFIGEPYDVNLDPRAKLATMDNIYYALLALNALGFDWTVHASERDALVNFISTSQASNGGFFNDKDYIFDSLDTYEPGLLSSFFAIRSLKRFGMHETIRINDFKDYLASLYDPIKNYFSISECPYYSNETNIIASVLGLELSDLVSFTSIDRSALIDFILEGRNTFGGWSSSTTISYHELIDTYQVIRSLENAGELDCLSYEDLVEIGAFVWRFRSQEGYAPLPPDYQAIIQLNSLATSFEGMNRISELPLQLLYDNIEGVLFSFYTENGKEFGGATGMFSDRAWFRSNPIEFATSCAHEYIPYLNSFTSIKWSSLALSTLDALYKLDDLSYHHNLSDFLNGVIASQFLDDGILEFFGGFINSVRMRLFPTTVQAHSVFLDNAYYAIRIIEILSTLLEIDKTPYEILLNSRALISYIARNMVETEEMYYEPRFGSATEDIMEHTYQALYILRSLGEADANHGKIATYLENHVDYENLKNVYFSYKINELYDIDFDFDIKATQSLIQATYCEEENNFFEDLTLTNIEPQAFGWVIEMAKNDEVNIDIQMGDIVPLGGVQNLTVSIGNMVLEQLGEYATVKFHSKILGTQTFTVQPDGTHYASIIIPTEPTYFPSIEGNISVYDGLVEIKRKSINFRTTYDLLTAYDWKNESGVFLIFLNASQVFGTIKAPLDQGTAFGKIFKDDNYMRTIYMTRDDMKSHSEFSLSYVPLNQGNYIIELFLNDGYNQTDMVIGEISINISQSPELNPNPNPLKQDEISLSVGLIIGFISLPGMTFFFSKRSLNRKKINYK